MLLGLSGRAAHSKEVFWNTRGAERGDTDWYQEQFHLL